MCLIWLKKYNDNLGSWGVLYGASGTAVHQIGAYEPPDWGICTKRDGGRGNFASTDAGEMNDYGSAPGLFSQGAVGERRIADRDQRTICRAGLVESAGFFAGVFCSSAGVCCCREGMFFIRVSTVKVVQPLQRALLPARTRNR